MITQRLVIRAIEVKDYNDLCEYGCDEETGQYMIHWPKSKEQIKEFIDTCIASMAMDNITWYEFVILLKESSKVIGNITLNIGEHEAEIGWISNKAYWNQGYMSEAVKAVIQNAFENQGIHKILATCTDKNIASYKIMEKCGMKKLKTEYNHKSIRQGVEVTYDRLTYSISI